MRLEEISVFEWRYDEDVRIASPGYALLRSYDSHEGAAYGEGRGSASGRIEGSVVWSNYPRRRSDDRMLPDVRGLITTSDGAAIVFEFRGRTIFDGGDPGRQNLVGWFEADHDRYRWVNDVVCIAEGRISDDGRMRIHVYAGIHELD